MYMNSTRTVITGIGLVTPFGLAREALAEGLYARRSAVVPLPENLSVLSDMIGFAAPCSDFVADISDFLIEDKDLKRAVKKSLKVMCRETQMALASAQRALRDAGLDFHGEPQPRVGTMFGSDYMLADPRSTEAAFRKSLNEAGQFHSDCFGANGVANVMPLWLLVWLPNMPACHISILNQFLGANNSLTMNEAAANATLRYAHDTIARGWTDIMVTGATGSRLEPIRVFQTRVSETLATPSVPCEQASRPFDRSSTGQVLGEGAAAFILESLDHARQRGAMPLAEYLAACDTMAGTHTADLNQMALVPDYRTAFVNVLRKVLALSGKMPDEVGFIHAHGLGVPAVDQAEAEAIDEVFGTRSTPIPVVAAKGAFGNLGAGAGAIELAAGIEALQRGVLFPTLNFEAFAADHLFRVVTDSETPAGDCFINLSAAFTGQTSAAMLGKIK